MAFASSFPRPLVLAPTSERVSYLQKVFLITFLGLLLSGITGVGSAFVVALVPALQGRLASIIIILGSFAIAQYVAPRLVFGEPKWIGFALGAVLQGIAMGYLLLYATIVSIGVTGNAFLLIGEAMGLTALTAIGMVAYLWSKPKELSFIRAALSGLALPMLLLMGISFVWPIGGMLGVMICSAFVVISTCALLYQMNQVIHKFNTDMYVEGAYLITMAILVLFWNLLSLLMRFNRR